MSTTFRRALVSLTLATAVTFAVTGCARPASQLAFDARSPLEPRPFTLRFDNEGRKYVHVYLIDENRQWLLGRVEPGAIAVLRVPDEAVARNSPFTRLAVLEGEAPTLQAARHPRAMLTIKQAPSALMSQMWWFSQGELMSVGRFAPKS